MLVSLSWSWIDKVTEQTAPSVSVCTATVTEVNGNTMLVNLCYEFLGFLPKNYIKIGCFE